MNDDRDTQPYYYAYDDRYRRVYAQGVEFWTAHPDEVRETTAALDRFLEVTAVTDPLILECGCGEGHLAMHLVERGYRYIGVDISPLAIDKARTRTAALTAKTPSVFHIANTTALGIIGDETIDVLVDNYHLHMLVTEHDRSAYLREARRVLRRGGWAYFRENLQQAGALESVRSFEDYVAATALDSAIEEEREAWQDGRVVRIKLPRLPARANSVAGYAAELAAAGFVVERAEPAGPSCIVYARKSDPAIETGNPAR